MEPLEPGVSLAPIAECYDSRGFQLVPTQWHRNRDKLADTPMSGVTGSAPFLGLQALDQIVDIGSLQLHREGGPECVGQFAKTAVRPPLYVVGFDVDDGYAGKSGGDTLVNAEMALGPLPGTFTLTARGPDTPSRRRWFRIPADLVVRDRFFTPYGGCIETIRTGHRYSWCAPAIHVRKGQVVGPVLWYGPDGRPADMPHVDNLAELPLSWVQAIRADNAEHARTQVNRDGVAAGQPTPIGPGHADAIVQKMIRKLHELHPSGGEFRNAVFGLAAAISRRTVAQGGTELDVHEQVEQVFSDHPMDLTVDEKDAEWIEDGIKTGWSEPWVFVDEPVNVIRVRYLRPTVAQFMAGEQPFVEATPEQVTAPTVAADDEVASFLNTFTAYRDPRALGRRMIWMSQDGAARLPRHAQLLVQEVVNGLYPADRALSALGGALRHHGHHDPSAPRTLLAIALGAVLTDKVA